jgi:AcrB/AcrD/AcrF family/Outer membrane efflux protein
MAKFFINRPIFAIVLSLMIMIVGALCIPSLPVAQYPQITPPTVEVEINYPGANAEEVEKSIASVVESAVNGAARAEFFPRISLTGLFGQQSLALSDLFTGPAKIWSIGPTVTLPIFTSGRNYSNLQATKALQEQTLVLYQFTVRQAFREVADGLIAHTEFREFRKEQEALVKSYLDYSQLANLRYKGGIDSYLAVLDADRQLFTAQLGLAKMLVVVEVVVGQFYVAVLVAWLVGMLISQSLRPGHPEGK